MANNSKARTQSKDNKGSLSSQVGLILSTARVKRLLKNSRCSERYSKKAIIYLTASLEYIIGELLEVSSMKAQESKKTTISNRHVYLGSRADKEIHNCVLGNTGYIKDAGFTTDNPLPVTKKSKKSEE